MAGANRAGGTGKAGLHLTHLPEPRNLPGNGYDEMSDARLRAELLNVKFQFMCFDR